MKQKDYDRYIDFLWKYGWIGAVLVIAILLQFFKSNSFIQTYGPRLAVLFFGLFLGIAYISKAKNKILTGEKQKRFWNEVGPLLIKRLKLDMIEILHILYTMGFLGLEGEIYGLILNEGKTSSKIDCIKLGEEFEKISKIISSINIEGKIVQQNPKNDIDYNKAFMVYYESIKIYLDDIQYNIAPIIFMHSENINFINLFLNLNGNIFFIKGEFLKLNKNLRPTICLSFSDLFNTFKDISINIICLDRSPNNTSINTNHPPEA